MEQNTFHETETETECMYIYIYIYILFYGLMYIYKQCAINSIRSAVSARRRH